MGSNLTAAGWIAKFIVVPGICVAVGYYLVGPRIGKRELPPTTETTQPAPEPPASGSAPTNTTTATPKPEFTQDQAAEASHVDQSAPTVHKRTKRHHSLPPPNSVSISSDNYPQAEPGEPSKDVGETGSESSVSH